MKKNRTLLLALALLLLVGAVVGITVVNQQSVTVYDSHDHDRDGKPDHDAGSH